MITWLTANIGTIFVAIILIVIISLAVYSMIKNKQEGRSSCGCKCSSCPMGGTCNNKK
ncbi:MAG: FeoB-associated Cys-rich membrane protein [Lachnospiraceae bacterium]|nr:FeoB-associated Cys-rich membrane protein [Lachnospiraceae bacterium]